MMTKFHDVGNDDDDDADDDDCDNVQYINALILSKGGVSIDVQRICIVVMEMTSGMYTITR